MRFLKIVSAVVLGLLLAAADYKVDLWIYVFSMLTASSLFLVSRQEPRMKWMALALYVVSVLVLIVSSFGTIFCLDSFVFMIFGVVGYRLAAAERQESPVWKKLLSGVFIYGIVPVLASYFLSTHYLQPKLLLPALGFGLLASLNECNRGRFYKVVFAVLSVLAWGALTAYPILRIHDIWHYLYLICLPVFMYEAYRMIKGGQFTLLYDLSAVLLAVLYGFGFVAFLL
jgi:hypothetical protein